MDLGKPPLLSHAEFDRLKAGDSAPFNKVYEAYFGLVAFVAGRLGMSGVDQEEIVQETFVKLFQHRVELQSPNTLKAWLCSTARNICLTRLRNKKSTRAVDEVAAADNGLDSHLRELELQLVGDLIDDVVAESGDDTLKLFYRDGLSAKDIAIMKGEAVSTVTTRLSRLRKRFKDDFERHINHLRAKFPL